MTNNLSMYAYSGFEFGLSILALTVPTAECLCDFRTDLQINA